MYRLIIILLCVFLNDNSIAQELRKIIDKSIYLINDGQIDKAKLLIDSTIIELEKQHKSDFELFYLRGYCKQQKDLLPEAIEDYDIALKLNDYHYASYYERASCFFLLGKYKEALNDFYFAYQIEKNEEVCFSVAYSYYYLRQFDESLKYVTESLKYNETFKAYDLRCKIKLLKRDIDINGAIADNESCKKTKPKQHSIDYYKIIENELWIAAAKGDNKIICEKLKLLERAETGNLFERTISAYKSYCD